MNQAGTINVGKETLKGTFWTYASNYSGQFLVFISTIILARLLNQDDYGVVGYAVVTTNLLNVLSDLGIGPALIYHRDEPKATDTAFWLGILFGFVLFGITWFIAPLAALYFRDPRAIPVIRVLAFTFPISAFGNVQDNILRKELAFKKKFVPEFVRASSKGVVSIGMAIAGTGAWSLIAGQLAGKIFSVISYWQITDWRPKFILDGKIARLLIRYGSFIVALNTLAVVLDNIDYILVGRYMGAAALGVYTLAFRIPELLITNLCGALAQVLFPVYVKVRDDSASLARAFLTTLRFVSVVTIPLGIGLALVTRSFVLTFLTGKWIEAIPVIQAISIFSVLFSLSYNTGSFYKARGQVNVMTWLALLRLAVTIPLIYWAAVSAKSVAAVGWVQAFVAVFSGSLNLYVASRSIKTSMGDILEAIRPAAISAAGMAAVVIPLNIATDNTFPAIQLVLGVLAGGAAYLAVLYWQQKDIFLSARQTLVTTFGRR